MVIWHNGVRKNGYTAGGGGVENPTNFLLQQIFMNTLSDPLLNADAQFLPLLAMSRRRVFMKESVSSECAISMWTALIVRHVKIQPYLFTWLLPCFSRNGPKQSIPTWLNQGCLVVTRSLGRSAIFWLHTTACWAPRTFPPRSGQWALLVSVRIPAQPQRTDVKSAPRWREKRYL